MAGPAVPIKLTSNEFWGLRSGAWYNKSNKRGDIFGFSFMGKRASIHKKENQGGVGRKHRGRKKYSNPKLHRRSGWN